MQKKFIAILAIAAIITGGIFIFGIVGYGTYGYIDESFSYVYASSNSSIENVDIQSDIGGIEITYNSTPMNEYMTADIDVHIEGIFVTGKTYSNFFEQPETVNNSADKSLALNMKPEAWFDPSSWFSGKLVTIKIKLRTDVIYNISSIVTTGNINVNIPSNVTVDGLSLISTTGNIISSVKNTNITKSPAFLTTTGIVNAYFENVILQETDITVASTTGNIQLGVLNSTFNKDQDWILTTTTGNAILSIEQDTPMISNVSTSIAVTTGDIGVYYVDHNSSIGAHFTGAVTTGNIGYDTISGFTKTITTMTSDDYNTANTIFTTTMTTTTGNIYAQGTSK